MMGGNVVIIAPDINHADEYFEELKKVLVVASDEFMTALKNAEREIICGIRSNQEGVGIFGAQEAMASMSDGFNGENVRSIY